MQLVGFAQHKEKPPGFRRFSLCSMMISFDYIECASGADKRYL